MRLINIEELSENQRTDGFRWRPRRRYEFIVSSRLNRHNRSLVQTPDDPCDCSRNDSYTSSDLPPLCSKFSGLKTQKVTNAHRSY